MAGLNVAELMVAAGEIIAAAPAGTANVALATAPAAPWVDLGYADEDGVTLSDSPSETNIGAWQSEDPVLVLTTEKARTFAFNLMQWNPDVLSFVFGGGMITPAPTEGATFAPGDRGKFALLMRWLNGDGDTCQFYVPRGKVTGDVGAQLTRTAAGVFTATFTSTPDKGLGEDAWRYTSDADAFAGATVVLTGEGQIKVEPAPAKSTNGGK